MCSAAKVQVTAFRSASIFLVLIYMLLSTKVMNSLLTAIFAGAYQRVTANSEVEYIYQKCQRVFYFKTTVSKLPPPLNLPTSTLKLIRALSQLWLRLVLRLYSSVSDPFDDGEVSALIILT